MDSTGPAGLANARCRFLWLLLRLVLDSKDLEEQHLIFRGLSPFDHARWRVGVSRVVFGVVAIRVHLPDRGKAKDREVARRTTPVQLPVTFRIGSKDPYRACSSDPRGAKCAHSLEVQKGLPKPRYSSSRGFVATDRGAGHGSSPRGFSSQGVHPCRAIKHGWARIRGGRSQAKWREG